MTPTDPSRPRLYTWHYRAALDALPEDVVLVRTSISPPKWISTHMAEALPQIKELAPYGMFHAEGAEFIKLYRKRLEKFGVERIERRFRELIDANDGRPLVLLCFEKSRQECHRGDFAEWWEQKTGEHIPEYVLHAPPPPDPEPPAQGELI